jgi:hypothetical protein
MDACILYDASKKYHSPKIKVSNIAKWRNRKMTGTGLTKKASLQKMIDRAIFELNISKNMTTCSSIRKKVFNQHFEANSLLSVLNADFDLFSKDEKIVRKSLEFSLKAIDKLAIPILDMTKFQVYGVCLLFHLVMIGYRTDYEEFGGEDLIANYKKRTNAKKVANNTNISSKVVTYCTVEEEEEEEVVPEKLVNDNVLDNWDD